MKVVAINGNQIEFESGSVFEMTEPNFEDLLGISFHHYFPSTAERNAEVRKWMERNKELEMPGVGDEMSPANHGWSNPLAKIQYRGRPGAESTYTFHIYPNTRHKAIKTRLIRRATKPIFQEN